MKDQEDRLASLEEKVNLIMKGSGSGSAPR